MIRYQLRCAEGHEFEGWFRNSAAFDEQTTTGRLACPFCGGVRVERALMAPALVTRGPAPARGAGRPEGGSAGDPSPAVPGSAAPRPDAMPDALRAFLARVREAVEGGCDYVGRDFAVEARRIHRGEAASRGIYGEATEAEREALSDEGIDVSRVPWVPRADG